MGIIEFADREIRISSLRGSNGKRQQVSSETFAPDVTPKSVQRCLRKMALLRSPVKIILSGQDTLIRTLEIKGVSLKDMDSFLRFNAREYFTLDAEKYEYDYFIQDSASKGTGEPVSVVLAAFPKKELGRIFDFCKEHRVKISGIEPLATLLHRSFPFKTNACLVFVDGDTVHFLSSERGRLFMTTQFSLPKDVLAEEVYALVKENLSGYLEFFSSRHYGKQIEDAMVIGEGEIASFSREFLQKEHNINVHMERNFLSGATKKRHPFRNFLGRERALDFSRKARVDAKNKVVKIILSSVATVAVLLLSVFPFLNPLLEQRRNMEEIESLERELAGLERVDLLLSKYQELVQEASFLESVEYQETKETFDTVKISDKIVSNLLDGATFSSLSVSNDGKAHVSVQFQTSGHVVEFMNHFNSLGVFERLTIDSLRLGAIPQEISFTLSLVQSERERFLLERREEEKTP